MTEDKGNNHVEIKHSTEKESSLSYIIFYIIVAIISHLVRPWNEHPEMAITIIILAVILIPIVIMRVMAHNENVGKDITVITIDDGILTYDGKSIDLRDVTGISTDYEYDLVELRYPGKRFGSRTFSIKYTETDLSEEELIAIIRHQMILVGNTH